MSNTSTNTNASLDTDFDDIRPYTDAEIEPAIKNLVADKEFLFMLLKIRFKWANKYWLFVFAFFMKLYLTYKFANIKTVVQVQDKVAYYVEVMKNKTTTEFSSSGLDQIGSIDAKGNNLFLSNHRDIVLDPAFVNYALYYSGNATVQIAIGDNLLQVPFISKLMRINKSFIVKRSAKSAKDNYRNSLQLSQYIYHAIAKGDNVWLAQKEGRAKDGIDKTDSVIIKMLHLSHRKQLVAEFMPKLHIAPVAISYEYDPCDIMKAKEIATIQKHGKYTKQPMEDIRSIKQGIGGYKGKVHVSFCPEIKLANGDEIQDIVDKIDYAIINNFYFMATHIAAYLWVCKQNNTTAQIDKITHNYSNIEINTAETKLLQRCTDQEQGIINILMQAYANPVISYLKLHNN